jgi:hypothetical protein
MSTHVLDIHELSAAIPMPVRTIQSLKDARKIPGLKIGHRSVRYELEMVLATLQKFEVKAVA